MHNLKDIIITNCFFIEQVVFIWKQPFYCYTLTPYDLYDFNDPWYSFVIKSSNSYGYSLILCLYITKNLYRSNEKLLIANCITGEGAKFILAQHARNVYFEKRITF